MSYAYINTSNLKNKPKFWLCLPYPLRTPMQKLTEVYNVNLKLVLGKVHELTFDMPAEIEREHELIKNPLIDKFQGYYQVKMVWNGRTEYFVYTTGNRKSDDGGRTLSYKLYSSAYMLSKKLIRAYDEESKTLSQHAREFLSQTNWKLDYVDADFDLKKRHMEIAESNSLQSLYDLATKFNAIIDFNTVLQKVSFHKPQNTGLNKGMTFKTGIFIESLGYEVNFDEIVTRLYVFGSDGLEFRRLSPTGSNYLEDLSWFMYPFECDSNYNVIKKSKWMTSELCVAYLKYQKKIADYTPNFKTLTTNKTNKEDEIVQRETELSTLESQLKQIENELWVINRTYLDQAPYRSDWASAVSRKTSKESEVNSKKSQITSLKAQVTSIESQILSLQQSLKVENNFTSAQIVEMNEFIHHKSYTNDSVVDEQDLLDDGIEAFKQVNQPPITISLDIVNFLNDIEHKAIHNRIALGDTVKVKSEDIDVFVELKIIEISYNFESDAISLTISNEADLRDDFVKLTDKIYSASNTSTQVNMDKFKWSLGETANNSVTDLLNNAWDAAKNALIGGHKGTTILDEYGLKSIDSSNPNTFLFINNGLLGVTVDGLNSVSVSISKLGIHAEKLVGKIILGNKLWIEDDAGVVEIKSALMTVYDQSGTPRVYLGRYPSPDNASQFKYGLRVTNGAFDIRTSNSTNSGVQIDGSGLRAFNNAGVKTFEVNATTGQVSIIGGISIKTSPDSYRGVELDGNGLRIYGNSGQLVFSADNFGNVFYAGRLQRATGSVDNLDGTFVGDLVAAGGTFTGTLNGVDGVFTGNLSAVGGTFTGALSAASGTFQGVVTGSLSSNTMKTINLDASQITTGGLTAERIDVQELSAISSNLGNITAGSITGTSINTEDDLYVGDRIYFQGWGAKRILFDSMNFIGDDGTGSVEIQSFGDINLITGATIRFMGKVDFSGAQVMGLPK